MSAILTVIFTPILLLISVPLFCFACFTTTLAFSTLLVRVLIVYIELAVVVIHNHLGYSRPKKSTPPQSNALKRNSSYRLSTTSSSGSLTPKVPHGIYSGALLTRDFEGVGGWRFPSSDDEEDSLWTSMNSRLELPKIGSMTEERKWKHRPSKTCEAAVFPRPGIRRSGHSTRSRPTSAIVSGTVSPEEAFSGRSRPVSAIVSGSVSPEEVAGGDGKAKSMPTFGEGNPNVGRARSMLVLGDAAMNVGRVRNGHRKSSESSTSSSSKTLPGSSRPGKTD